MRPRPRFRDHRLSFINVYTALHSDEDRDACLYNFASDLRVRANCVLRALIGLVNARSADVHRVSITGPHSV